MGGIKKGNIFIDCYTKFHNLNPLHKSLMCETTHTLEVNLQEITVKSQDKRLNPQITFLEQKNPLQCQKKNTQQII